MAALPSGLAEQVADEESLARFLTSSNQYNNSVVKPRAFLPRPGTREASVFRHGPTPEPDLWRLGDAHVGAARSIKGVAIIVARNVRSAVLDVLSDEPPKRHANITGWEQAPDNPEWTKTRQIQQAQSLAQKAQLIHKPAKLD